MIRIGPFLLALTCCSILTLSSSLSANPFLVAHRGASGDAPENTLPAFELAWKQGADAIEGDFHLTSDGHVICFHDADTRKRTGKKLVIKEHTLADLRKLDAGSWKHSSFAGTRIPTFKEVAATIPAGRKIYIEIKCGPEIIAPLLTDIRACDLDAEQLVVISFNAEVIRQLKKQRPQWTANFLYSFDRKVADAPSKEWDALLLQLKDIGADGLGSSAHLGITRPLLKRLEAAGFQHHVWTVNDRETARHFLAIGTKSITTDFPAALRQSLETP